MTKNNTTRWMCGVCKQEYEVTLNPPFILMEPIYEEEEKKESNPTGSNPSGDINPPYCIHCGSDGHYSWQCPLVY